MSKQYAPVRSVRVEDVLWVQAQRRARREGLTMSEVLHRFVQGYASGRLNAPQVQIVYSKTGATT